MRQVGYEGVFWTLKLTKVSLGVLAFAISGVFLVANARMLAGSCVGRPSRGRRSRRSN